MIRIWLKSLLAFSAVILMAADTFAAACCGGGFATPALIAGDDRAQVTSSYSQLEIKNDVDADGFWRQRESNETGRTLKLDAAWIPGDLWQIGMTVPIIERNRGTRSSTGLGDLSASLGYEYLPDWDYNPWRPKGIGYLQLTAPTGRSVYDSERADQLDSRGRGFWALGAGTLLTKIIRRWDLFLTFDAHRAFARAVSKSDGNSVSANPGYSGNLGFGAGYSLRDYRMGSSLTWTYEDPIRIDDETSSPQRYATWNLQVSYLFETHWSASLAWSDQTLFGAPVNTSLGRAVTLQIQRRWQR